MFEIFIVVISLSFGLVPFFQNNMEDVIKKFNFGFNIHLIVTVA